jgi:Na+/proline symporter
VSPVLAIGVILLYLLFLFVISLFTSKNSSSDTFFTANRRSPWYLVAYGMIGVSLSGITFISVPGEVGRSQFSYLQLVIGYVIGIWITAAVLLPLYYRYRFVSIYEFMRERFGFWSYKTSAAFFIIAQTTMAAFRLYLMAAVLQLAFFDAYSIPFEITVLVTVLLIWLYTYRSGIKTVVITDTLQTTFLLASVVLSIIIIGRELGLSLPGIATAIRNNPDSRIFFWQWNHERNFFKLVFTGVFLTIVTNGLDHSVMQKHLTCPSLRESQKNMFWYSTLLFLANVLILCLGLLLYVFAGAKGITLPARSDDLYPMLALHHLSTFTGVVFLLGIAAAAYSSADSALTALTTSFCVDFLNFAEKNEQTGRKIRILVHLGMSMLLYLVIVLFRILNDESVINSFIRVSGYTYGPLLGLFAFGMFTKRKVFDRAVPLICILSPALSVLLYFKSESWFWGYKFGFEILIVNGLLTFIGLLSISGEKG